MTPRHQAWWALGASLLLHAALLGLWPRAPAEPTSPLHRSTPPTALAAPATTTITAYLVPVAPAPLPSSQPPPTGPRRTAVPTRQPDRTPATRHTPMASVAPVAPMTATLPAAAEVHPTTAHTETPAAPNATTPLEASTGTQLNTQLPPTRATVPQAGHVAASGRLGPTTIERPALPSYRGPPPSADWGRPSTTRLAESRSNQGDLRAEVVTPAGRYCLRARASSRMQELRDSPSFDRAINPTHCD